MADGFKFPDEIEAEELAKGGKTKAEDELEIEVVDDVPEKDRGRKPLDREVAEPTDEELDTYSDTVKKRIKELTHARHDERRGKEAVLREKQELERVAQSLAQENNRLRAYADNGTKHLVTATTAAAEAELAKARKDLKDATEAFDTDKIVAAQEELAAARWKLENIKNFRPQPLQQQETVVQTQQQGPSQVKPDEKSLRWQAKNQWFGSDGFEEVTSYALGLHQKLVNSGVDPRSDEYYEAVDSRVRGKFPEVFGQSNQQGSKRPASVVAPGTRSSGTKKVTLTTTQVALAKKLGIPLQTYAAQVAKLEN